MGNGHQVGGYLWRRIVGTRGAALRSRCSGSAAPPPRVAGDSVGRVSLCQLTVMRVPSIVPLISTPGFPSASKVLKSNAPL